jgi:hypothetical protein
MLLAAQLSDDQVAIIGCAVVFGACLLMMVVSQKVGDRVRGRSQSSRPEVVPFPVSAVKNESDRKAA